MSSATSSSLTGASVSCATCSYFRTAWIASRPTTPTTSPTSRAAFGTAYVSGSTSALSCFWRRTLLARSAWERATACMSSTRRAASSPCPPGNPSRCEGGVVTGFDKAHAPEQDSRRSELYWGPDGPLRRAVARHLVIEPFTLMDRGDLCIGRGIHGVLQGAG